MYRLLEGPATNLALRPRLHLRRHADPVSTAVPAAYPWRSRGEAQIEIDAPRALPDLRLAVSGENATFVGAPAVLPDVLYATEKRRGYACVIAGYHWFADWGRDTITSNRAPPRTSSTASHPRVIDTVSWSFAIARCTARAIIGSSSTINTQSRRAARSSGGDCCAVT